MITIGEHSPRQLPWMYECISRIRNTPSEEHSIKLLNKALDLWLQHARYRSSPYGFGNNGNYSPKR
ncbi:hypothetical protein OK016_28225 [Vibrio chagasii]|nr:hypothetical protein [Vibrio chagasii]